MIYLDSLKLKFILKTGSDFVHISRVISQVNLYICYINKVAYINHCGALRKNEKLTIKG